MVSYKVGIGIGTFVSYIYVTLAYGSRFLFRKYCIRFSILEIIKSMQVPIVLFEVLFVLKFASTFCSIHALAIRDSPLDETVIDR